MSDEAIVAYLKNYQGKIRIFNLLIFIMYIAIPFVFLMTFYEMSMGRNFVPCLIIAVAVCVIIGPLAKKLKSVERERKRFIGDYIVRPILTEKIDVKEYSPNSFVSKNIINNSHILPGYDEISGSDFVKGTYRGVEILFSDLTLVMVDRERDRNGRRRTTRTVVFKGHFFRITLGKELNGYVRIMERKNPRKKGFLSDLLNSTAELMGMKANTVEVESEAFNNQFEIRTNDDELAFYILTPHFMENVVKADELADGYTNIAFEGNHVDMSLNNHQDSFEITKSVSKVEDLRRCRAIMKKDLDIMLAIADEILAKERMFN